MRNARVQKYVCTAQKHEVDGRKTNFGTPNKLIK